MGMFEKHSLTSWLAIFRRLGLPEQRRGRARCPLCGASARSTAFSCHEERGFHCFRCGRHGDKVSFIQQLHKCSFKDALRWFGLAPGRPPQPDPIHTKAQTIRENLRAWKQRIGRQSRDLLAARHEVEVCARERLKHDAQDDVGWQMLEAAFKNYDRDEHIADCVAFADEHDDIGLLRVYRELGKNPYDES